MKKLNNKIQIGYKLKMAGYIMKTLFCNLIVTLGGLGAVGTKPKGYRVTRLLPT